MKKGKILSLMCIGILILTTTITSVTSAYQIKGKQKISIQGQGLDNEIPINITNTGDTTLLLSVKPTKQNYSSKNIKFGVGKNWLAKYKNHEWEEVNWIEPDKKTVSVAPNTKKTVKFEVSTDKNISSGTFYAQFETKDISEKKGTVIIRTVYVTQVAGNIEKTNLTVIPGFRGILAMFAIGIVAIFIKIKIKL